MPERVSVDDDVVTEFIRQKMENSADVPGYRHGEEIFEAALDNPDSMARYVCELMWFIEDQLDVDSELGFQATTSEFRECGADEFGGFMLEDIDGARILYDTVHELAQHGIFMAGYADEHLFFDCIEFMPETEPVESTLGIYTA